MHVRELIVIVGQKVTIREDKLEAVVQEAVLVEDQNQPGQSFVSWLDILQLRVDVRDATVV